MPTRSARPAPPSTAPESLAAALAEALPVALAEALPVALAEALADAGTSGRLLTDAAAAERLAVSRAGLWRIVARGQLTPVRIGRSTRFALGALDALARRGAPLAS